MKSIRRRGSSLYSIFMNFTTINFLLLFLACVIAINYSIRKRKYFQIRSQAFDGYIQQAADRYAIPPALIKAIIWQESRFDPWAINRRSGAIGLMQLMNNKYGAISEWQQTLKTERPTPVLIQDPNLNIDIGTWYFARAVKYWERYYSDSQTVFCLALAEYNAGRFNASKWRPKDQDGQFLTEQVDFKETKNYVILIMNKWKEYQNEQPIDEIK